MNFFKSKLTPLPVHINNDANDILSSEISDWGIEDNNSITPVTANSNQTMLLSPTVSTSSTTTTGYHFPAPNPPFLKHQSFRKPSSTNSDRSRVHLYQPQRNLTQDVSKFIKKYLSLENRHIEFWEKFKYTLILSNLLEDSMILSKNELAIKQEQHEEDNIQQIYINDQYDTVVKIINRSIEVQYNRNFNKFNLIIIIINFIIYLMKQQKQSQYTSQSLKYETQLNMFKFLLINSSKLIKIRKVKLTIYTNRIFKLLNEHLLLNYKINKKLIINLMKIKGGNLNLINLNINHRQFLINQLNLLNLSIKSYISKLLPFMNGDLFQQYCTINNINLSILNQELEDELVPMEHINKFNQLRKFFICQLLAINEMKNVNFFIYNLMDQFEVNESEQEDLSNLSKMELLIEILEENNQILQTMNELFKKYDVENVEILEMSDDFQHHNSNLDDLISKLENLTTNMKFFKKYDQSISNQDVSQDEQIEKVQIFKQFNQELEDLNQMYKLSLNDLNHGDIPSSPSYQNSSPIQQQGQFNLKTFHNPSIKKRFSLPPSQINNKTKPKPTNSKYKRLSTGLQLGLLTVFEEEPKESQNKQRMVSSANSLPISFDDNYLNILPPSQYETYNQSTLDQLNNKPKLNRFSLNSMHSNISGITDLTSFEDENNNRQFTKEELKIKLEESFNKIYNLEHENKQLRFKEKSDGESQVDSNQITTFNNIAFLSELENKLDTATQ